MNKTNFKGCYDEIEKRQSGLEDKWSFCNEHKFEHECKALNIEIDALGFALRKLRYYDAKKTTDIEAFKTARLNKLIEMVSWYDQTGIEPHYKDVEKIMRLDKDISDSL